MLRSRFRDTHTALLWLRNNRHLFEGNVYEPMMLVVGVLLFCEECVPQDYVLEPVHFIYLLISDYRSMSGTHSMQNTWRATFL